MGPYCRYCRTLLLAALAALCTTSAYASATADFDGDGIPDRVVVAHGHDTPLVVEMSGAGRQVLNFHGRILSVLAVDLNRDGAPDVTALSERRGVLVWLNHGHRGRFRAVHQRLP